jgi:hypothetical protein
MAEPDQIEFHERVTASSGKSGAQSRPVRIGIVVGAAALVVVGAVTAMGASPSPSATGSQGLPSALVPAAGTQGILPLDGGFFHGGDFGRGGFHDITISAINGSSISLKTDDGWTRTITVGSSTAITKAGVTIALGDLSVGDQIRFSQEEASDGTYSITAIRVVLPTIAGEVTAVSGDTITVIGKDGTTDTIHVDGSTTYSVNGTAGKALSDVTVGSFVVAEGTSRADGSLDADAVQSGSHGLRDGHRGGPGFRKDADPNATPTPSSTAS